MTRTLSKHIFIPLLERISNGSTLKCLQELNRTQWLPVDDLKQIQQNRLQSLITHTYENVPFYRKILQERGLTPDNIKTVEDLSKLPILTKQDIREHFEELIAVNYSKKRMKLCSTGGSTGEPLDFLKPKDLGWSFGAWYRGLSWYGYEPGDKHVVIAGARLNMSYTDSILLIIGRFLRRQMFLPTVDLSEKQIIRFVANLRRFQPKIIIGYPSSLYVLAGYINDEGIRDIRPKAIITNSEKLYDHQRQTINQAFDCEVFEQYGCGEVLSIGYECPNHHGYHVITENVVLEVVKDNDQPALPGEMGRIVVTDLHNYAMPFIRYDTCDLGVLSDEGCSCGRAFPIVKTIEGRISDIITLEDRFIAARSIDLVFRGLPVEQYQVVQDKKDEIVIKIVKAKGYLSENTDSIVQTLHKFFGRYVKFQLEFVDSIPLTQAGKRRVVISKVTERQP